ncbi:hypothetical protein G5B35_21230 [Parapusillimonas sp. SGNA-6]|nr:hypothetical protein [Parapedobacter sp. SGR-10]NGM89827.1 hypothetical protein [Parapusillimonas sp. SGNA-6]
MMLRLKHIIMTVCAMVLCCMVSYAQQDKQERFKAIESEKMAYITKELKLTPTEAQKFFPIYNKYNEEMWELKRAKRGAASAPQGANSFSGGKRDVIAFDAKEVDIKKKYRTQFAQVVGPSRASQFFQVVEDFNDLLRSELQNRRNKDRGR